MRIYETLQDMKNEDGTVITLRDLFAMAILANIILDPDMEFHKAAADVWTLADAVLSMRHE